MGVAKYGKPEEMQAKINEYFLPFEMMRNKIKELSCQATTLKELKSIDQSFEKPTSSGLAFFLGFNSRSSYLDYGKKPTFASTIKRANLRLRTFWEPLLSSTSAGGAMYWLNNSGDGWASEKVLENRAIAETPKVALVVFVKPDGTKEKQQITIEAQAMETSPSQEELQEIKQLTKPPHIAKNCARLGRPKKRGKISASCKCMREKRERERLAKESPSE